MKRIFLALFAGMVVSCLQAQKPALSENDLDNWPSVGSPAISNDGNYVLYFVRSGFKNPGALVIQSLGADWRMEIPGVSDAVITEDSKNVYFKKGKDSLGRVAMGARSPEYIGDVSAYQLAGRGKDELLAYETKDRVLILNGLTSGLQRSYSDVLDFSFSKDGRRLLLLCESKNDSTVVQALHYIDLGSRGDKTIWQGKNAAGFLFDDAGGRLAFVVETKKGDVKAKAIWTYTAGTDSAVFLADDHNPGISAGVKIDGINRSGFCDGGDKLYINLKEDDYVKPDGSAVKVDLWSYMDPKVQSEQLKELDPHARNSGPKSYVAVIGLQDHRILRLQGQDEQLYPSERKTGFESITYRRGGTLEQWDTATRPAYFLASVSNGKRTPMKMPVTGYSAGGRFVLCEDSLRRDFYAYDPRTGRYRNVTSDLPIPLKDADNDEPGNRSRGIFIAAAMDDGNTMLIYDPYDIWQVDLTGRTPPINLTNGYGRRHHVIFKLAENYRVRTVTNGEILLLSAFNRDNKNNGFFRIVAGRQHDPDLLSMGPYMYQMPDHYNPSLTTFAPMKARDAEVWLVNRETASESPNYFITTDFKTFRQISHVYPEKAVNWLTSQLITWKTFDGTVSQGILYKPEDFDPSKKYPLIIHYYERMSDKLHEYERPEYMLDFINIPWFVSHGYLVFTPDIHYRIGFTGESAVNTIVSAATYLAKFPWVDPARMGIQGHSFGGYETNYVVTHSRVFAAALSSSGFCDLVSAAGEVMYSSGEPFFQDWAQNGQGRIGATLWQRPDLYIRNSPIFQADSVVTPLLMMNNKEDGIVNFSQGVEFYLALRRLGKKVWMEQYDGELHSLINPAARKLHTIRVMQFFDHYLKGAPPPVWMTRGIPAKRKGLDEGLEPDNSLTQKSK